MNRNETAGWDIGYLDEGFFWFFFFSLSARGSLFLSIAVWGKFLGLFSAIAGRESKKMSKGRRESQGMDAWEERKGTMPRCVKIDTELKSSLKMWKGDQKQKGLRAWDIKSQNRQNTIPPETLGEKITEKGIKQMCKYQRYLGDMDERFGICVAEMGYEGSSHHNAASTALLFLRLLACSDNWWVPVGIGIWCQSHWGGSCTFGMVLYPMPVFGRGGSGLLGG